MLFAWFRAAPASNAEHLSAYLAEILVSHRAAPFVWLGVLPVSPALPLLVRRSRCKHIHVRSIAAIHGRKRSGAQGGEGHGFSVVSARRVLGLSYYCCIFRVAVPTAGLIEIRILLPG